MDQTIVKGFRTSCAYYPESTYGTFSVTKTKCQRIGGKLKGVNWNARQNIIQTGNVGEGRNYKQQLFGAYDANASLNFDVIDFSFLRHAVGDIGCWNADGNDEASPFFLIEAELSGTDGDGTSQALLDNLNNAAYTKIRVRPFSMLLYDMENVTEGTTWNDSVDLLSGCMISDFSLSSSVNSPLVCNVNMVAKEVAYRRFLSSSSSELPDFTTPTAFTDDFGNGYLALSPKGSQYVSNGVPLMFYNGLISIDGYVLGQVQSFNYGYNNSLITYRSIGDRFISMPQLGMRRQSFNMSVIFSLPSGDGSPAGTQYVSGTTTILELIKNYLGYASTAAFLSTQTLRPALATTASTTSPQITKPIEKTAIKLYFKGNDYSGNDRGAIINVRYAAIEGFGVPVQLENGLIEIPISCSVRGQPYSRISDGSYNGYDPTGNNALSPGVSGTAYYPTFMWWETIVNS